MLDFRDRGQKVSRYLRVGLLLLLLADERLQSLDGVRTGAEIRGELLLEALHPHRELRRRRTGNDKIFNVMLQSILFYFGGALPPLCVCRKRRRGPAAASSVQPAG